MVDILNSLKICSQYNIEGNISLVYLPVVEVTLPDYQVGHGGGGGGVEAGHGLLMPGALTAN